MQYNKERIYEFINKLGMQTEIDGFLKNDLTYHQLALVLNKVFSVDYVLKKLGFTYFLSKDPNHSKHKRNLNLFKKMHGIGVKDKKTFTKLGEISSLSGYRVNQVISKFDKKIFSRPFEMISAIPKSKEWSRKYHTGFKKEIYYLCLEEICKD